MKVGVFTPLLSQLSLEDVLKKLKSLNIDTVELGTGNYPGDPHCKLTMLSSAAELRDFKQKLADHGFSISALSCHGNPLHPDSARARHDQDVSAQDHPPGGKAGRPGGGGFQRLPGRFAQGQVAQLGHLPLASRLSGDPQMAVGEGRGALLDQARPVRRRSRRQDRHRDAPGLRGLQPGDDAASCAPSPDPPSAAISIPATCSGRAIDPIAAIRLLGDCIFHVHAKDTQIYERNLPLTGVLDTKSYTDERNRAWIFRTCGYGHDAGWWKEFASTLRMFGYDYVLSIEHEDSLLSPEEGLTKAAELLNGLVMRQQPAAAWWV